MWTFEPILKTTLWGGSRIARFKGLTCRASGIGESWEVSDLDGNVSVVASGPDKGRSLRDLIQHYGADLTGRRNHNRFGERFPLLVKIIDADSDLSVQVHPDDEMARRYGFPNGKSEMWYVVDAASGSRLGLGFNCSLTRDRFVEMSRSGDIEQALRFLPVRECDAFLIPPGTVHAIGKGVMLVEIQQTSDITYRLYDYRRKDSAGNERELHIDKGTEAVCLDFTDCAPVGYRPMTDIPVCLADTPNFTVNVVNLDHDLMRDYSELDSFVILTAVKGNAVVSSGGESVSLACGTSVLIPASTSGVTLTPVAGGFTCLESFVR